MPFTLPALKFGYDDLSPAVSESALKLHHRGHHREYVDELNRILSPFPQFATLTIEELLLHHRELPDEIRSDVLHLAGGHANHQFFWKILCDAGEPTRPEGDLLEAIERKFGSFETLQTRFEELALSHFGSGWIFLVTNPQRDYDLELIKLPDNGSVLALEHPLPGLMLCDLWEHAYYLDWRNRRADWLRAFWGLIDWETVARRLASFRAGSNHL